MAICAAIKCLALICCNGMKGKKFFFPLPSDVGLVHTLAGLLVARAGPKRQI